MAEELKVAAYVRVSVESVQMHHSLEAQKEYYKQMIDNEPNWEFAGIYADKGISGTRIKQRIGFCEMIRDCEVGKINKILVKSVSRFSRNTVDLLNIVRKLKSQNISVWFEEQKIDSMTEEGELMLTLIVSIAQAESESISENEKWAIRKRFEQGIGNTKRRTFGYKWADDQMVIIPEEAEIVKQIFSDFLRGSSYMKIVDRLTEKGITTVNGKLFSTSAISRILRNITYTGNTLLQKTFIQDPISKKKRINKGELPQYFVENTHEAIIEMDTFQKVQEIFAYNKEAGKFPYNRTGKMYPFTKKVICSRCGRHYTRQLWNTSKNGEKCPIWVCTGKRTEKHRRCDAKNIKEEKLMKASAEVLGLVEFDEARFDEMVESITVEKDGKLNFFLHQI